jgi:4'-phosphopantetheinyl transferase
MVDVWVIALDVVSGEDAARGDLTAHELDRARRLRFEVDRRRFVAGRSALRQILGRCLGVSPVDVSLVVAPGGKPYLDTARHRERVWFNLSHSGDLALLAVSADGEVGVDVERVRPLPDLEAVAARWFSPREQAALAALPPEGRVRAFFSCWTLKEAYLKACGDGLSRRLAAFDVTVGDGWVPCLLEVRDRPGDERRWTLIRLEPGDGYVAGAAVQRDGLATSP